MPSVRRGIVMAAGGSYLEPAFVSLYILRQREHAASDQPPGGAVSGPVLPVEVWSSRLIDGLMAPGLRKKLESLPDVTVHYLEDAVGADTVAKLLLRDQPSWSISGPPAGSTLSQRDASGNHRRPYVLKVLALLACSFGEALLLDGDNIPIADLTPLFNSVEFRQTGAIFWPDFWRADERFSIGSNPTRALATDASALRLIFGGYQEEANLATVESGQLLVDKQKGWTALLLSLYIMLRADHYAKPMREVYNVGADGDRQVFPLAWKALHRTYHLIETAPASAGYRAAAAAGKLGVWCGATEVQHDLEGRAMFLHRNMDKLNQRATQPRLELEQTFAETDGHHGMKADEDKAVGKKHMGRVQRWETVYGWNDRKVGVWGETRVEYGCKPNRNTVWLAGNTTDVEFVEYILRGRGRNTAAWSAWAAGLNDLVETALDHLL